MFGRRLFGMERSITPEQAADSGFDLKGALA
jgi:3-phenylpropionate/trans-cinnamate dioxygenase ferredoxin reductase component